ncbi:hypothetical protein TNCV_1579571 [Trichonephila clavipes]|nr:hypothetical protein TNCV_1579571 [Trichonephila clavipes]
MITFIADVSCTPIGPPLPKSRPPLQTHVPNTTNIRVPDRGNTSRSLVFADLWDCDNAYPHCLRRMQMTWQGSGYESHLKDGTIQRWLSLPNLGA